MSEGRVVRLEDTLTEEGERQYARALAWIGGMLTGLMRDREYGSEMVGQLTGLDPKFVEALMMGQAGGVGHLVWERIAKALDVPFSIFNVPDNLDEPVEFDRKLRE